MFDLEAWLVARQEIPHLVGVHKREMKRDCELVHAKWR